MGAQTFTTKWIGKTADDAYRSAVDDALWLHGHGGYTGTIAEKSGWLVCPIPATPQFRLWLGDGEELHCAFVVLDDFDTAADLQAFVERYDTTDRYVNVATVWEKRSYKALRDLLLIATPRQVLETYRIWRDKWGPALCIDLGLDTYMFMGWASC